METPNVKCKLAAILMFSHLQLQLSYSLTFSVVPGNGVDLLLFPLTIILQIIFSLFIY